MEVFTFPLNSAGTPTAYRRIKFYRAIGGEHRRQYAKRAKEQEDLWVTEFHGLFQQEVAGEPFDVGFILAVGMCFEGQVQVFVGQVEAVLQR